MAMTRGCFTGVLTVAALTLAGGAGCHESALPSGPGTGGMIGSGGIGGEGGQGGVYPPPRSCSGLGPAPLQLIDAQEYDNSIHTLLPMTATPSPPTVFPGRSSWARDWPQNMTVPPVVAETYLDVAEQQAWAQRGDGATALLRAGCQAAGASELEPMACAGGLATLIGERAYRRPLFDEERQILVEAFGEGLSDSAESGVVALVMSVLQAPQFVYRVELGDGSQGQGQQDPSPPTPYELAARLSALLLGDLPDDPLRAAAAAGQLRTADQVGTQVKRLLADPRGHAVSERFYRGWLSDFVGEGGVVNVARDPKLFPTFTPAAAVDMTREVLRFVDHHFWETDSDVASLLTAPYTFVTPALAQHYGLTVPAGSDPATLIQVPLDGRRRGGLLTQGALMTGMAHYTTTSPVQRGKFVVEAMLCMQLPSPPASVPPLPPDLPPPNATNRQVVEAYTSIPQCSSCHQLMNPPGFTLEHFDPVGRWQDTDHGLPIDSSADLRSPLWDPPATVVGAMELAALMARSDTVRQCVVRTWFRFAFGRPADDNTDRCVLQDLDAAFRAGGSHVRDLVPLLTTSRPYLAPSRDRGGDGI